MAALKQRPYPLPPLPPNLYYVEDTDPPTSGHVVFTESSDPFDAYSYQLQSIVYSGQTAVQRVLIADTYNYGRALMLDGAIQSSQDDEALYHATCLRPPRPHPNFRGPSEFCISVRTCSRHHCHQHPAVPVSKTCCRSAYSLLAPPGSRHDRTAAPAPRSLRRASFRASSRRSPWPPTRRNSLLANSPTAATANAIALWRAAALC